MATTTKQDGVRELQRTLYRTAKAAIARDGRMPAVKDVGEPCAGEPHARFEVAAGGNPNQSAIAARNWAPPADPYLWWGAASMGGRDTGLLRGGSCGLPVRSRDQGGAPGGGTTLMPAR